MTDLLSVGVLTKPDRIPTGEAEQWTRYIRNEKRPLENGWFSVKRPESQAIKNGITWEEACREENDYFTSTSPWSMLEFEHRQRLGTTNLTEKLSHLLCALIAKRYALSDEHCGRASNSPDRLPELHDELQKLIRTTEESLHSLPKPPSEDAFAEIFHLIGEFIRDLGVYLKGTPYADGLLQVIRPHQITFRNAVRATAPRFRAQTDEREYPLNLDDGDGAAYIEAETFGFLANEEDAKEFVPPQDDTDVISIHDVVKRADECVAACRTPCVADDRPEPSRGNCLVTFRLSFVTNTLSPRSSGGRIRAWSFSRSFNVLLGLV